MRWIAKRETQVGDVETVTRFAWVPTRVNNRTAKVWLERYQVTRTYACGWHGASWEYSNYRSL